MQVRLVFSRENVTEIYEGHVGDTYADALLALCVVPDTVLIYANGKCLPEDKIIEEEEVMISTTSSRG